MLYTSSSLLNDCFVLHLHWATVHTIWQYHGLFFPPPSTTHPLQIGPSPHSPKQDFPGIFNFILTYVRWKDKAISRNLFFQKWGKNVFRKSTCRFPEIEKNEMSISGNRKNEMSISGNRMLISGKSHHN